MPTPKDNTAPKHGENGENPQDEWSKAPSFPSAPPFNVEVGDEAKPYSSDFFGYGSELKKASDDSWDSTMTEEESATDAAERINSLINEELNKPFRYAPAEFDTGQHMVNYVLNYGPKQAPLSVAHFSNESFQKINQNEDGHITIATVERKMDALEVHMTELDMGLSHNDLQVADLSAEISEKEKSDLAAKHGLKSENSLRLHYEVHDDKRTLNCDTTDNGPRCFQITGKGVYDLSSVQNHDELLPGDIIVILSSGLMKSLTSNVARKLTRGAYEGPVLYKGRNAGYNPRTAEEATDIPRELLESEVANQLQELIKEAYAGPNLKEGESVLPYENTPFKRVFQKLSELAKPSEVEKWGTNNTEAFVIYQIP